ncbi:uncharacterized protein LOC133191647 [Saccostrea echinata]|uniref:uncharacterized protein LOC133191647 n=1 Tax=Saccostrea echinata TaxID=191078 RepID=UPI002A836C8A|nr:uncharacterized protein LOC133191647 [Saccostrea echinata]
MGGSPSVCKISDERCRYVQHSLKRAAKDCGDDIDCFTGGRSEDNINPAAEDYPFENVVFEGGGFKTLSYMGVIKALEDANILMHLERFAGASAGAYVAMLLAMECSKEEIEKIIMRYPAKLYESCACCMPCNILSYYGWQPYENEYNFMGKIIEQKLGNKDATFLDLYIKKKKELCVVIANISTKEEEYMHVKTTPNVPLRDAIRMSCSYPGFFRPVVYHQNGIDSYMIDGGLVSNYPIHCYDGWWLSMEKEDTFFNKLQEFFDTPYFVGKTERFRSREKDRNKTLGFAVFSNSEDDVFKSFFEHDRRYETVKYPDTPLGRKAKKTQQLKKEEITVKEAFRRLIQAMRKRNVNENDAIQIPILREILNDEKFTRQHRETLFGKGVTVEDILKRFDTHNSGWTNEKFAKLLEGIGYDILHGKFLGEGSNIDGVISFGSSVLGTITRTCDRIYFKEEDLDRTVGINTQHIDTFSANIKKEDKEFIIQIAYDTTMDFLKKYAKQRKGNRYPVAPESMATLYPQEEDLSDITYARVGDLK